MSTQCDFCFDTTSVNGETHLHRYDGRDAVIPARNGPRTLHHSCAERMSSHPEIQLKEEQ